MSAPTEEEYQAALVEAAQRRAQNAGQVPAGRTCPICRGAIGRFDAFCSNECWKIDDIERRWMERAALEGR